MATLNERQLQNEALERIAVALDLAETQYEAAKSRYDALGKFLASDQKLGKFNPKIMPQGSIRLGTAVRLVVEDDEYDVDVTCVVQARLPEKQSNLRKLFVARLNSDPTYAKLLETPPPHRCERLQYSESSKFHMDLVPALPDDYAWITAQGVPENFAKHAINITDNESPDYDVSTSTWKKSNTEGFALWFLEIIKKELESRRTVMFSESVAKINDFNVRTPLQRAIQIMKRHRDTMFEGDDDKPVSIIITTLAARSYIYLQETNAIPESFIDLLDKLLTLMPQQIEHRGSVSWISNPVNPKENFADKWETEPAKAQNFHDWVGRAKLEIAATAQSSNLLLTLDAYRGVFGNRAVSEATTSMTNGRNMLMEAKTASMYQVPHRAPLPWHYYPRYSVTVTGKYKNRKGFLKQWEWFDLNNDTIPKKRELIFKASTTVPEPFDVYWQVVNTGAEAETLRQVRGTVFPAKSRGRGGLEHTESTLYTGTHWIECFIVKDGVCVAKSGEYPVRIR